MKLLKTGLCLAVAAAGLTLAPSGPSVAVGTPGRAADDTSVTAQMRETADGTVRTRVESATGKLGFIAARGAQADLLPGVGGTGRTAAIAKATQYLDRFGSAFGLAAGQAKQTRVLPSRYGYTVVFAQKYQGLPVFGAQLKANVDNAGDLTSVTGLAVPVNGLSVKPRLTAADAGSRAVGLVKVDPPTNEKGGAADTSGVRAGSTALSVYRLGAIRGDTGRNVLVYVVEVTNGKNIRDMVFVDANTGKPVNRYSLVHDALERELKEATGTAQAPVLTTVWEEGDPFPGTLNTDQQNLVLSAGESYWLYENAFGRDSYDGEGARMVTVNNDPRINCPNANWNGNTTNYCNGVTSDDVVSHEWGHAYTEYTSGLIYQYQSGALNESYSDVWGETLDLINAREDEGEGDITVKRPDGGCEPTAPAQLIVNITAPAGAAGPCTARAGFGPTFDTTGVTTDVVVGTDLADASGPSTTDGCTAFTNVASILGKYVYVDRGTCSFQVKANNAVAAGATGLVVGQNVAGLPSVMSGTSTIPALMVTQGDGLRIKNAGTVTMTIKAEDISGRTASTRWLIGEKSEAFGGAIRDMWNPTCYGHPAKVTDAEYNCDPNLTDGGGVHSNSGVPNHAYALLVDGGTFNGQTVSGIGLDKAAAIWWRTQLAHLNPASDFTEMADALEQSCVELVGQPINTLTTVANATPVAATPITTADCSQVTKVTLATEMRKDPVQCNFQPLLAQGDVSPCGSSFTTSTTVLDDFEGGIAAWTLDQTLAAGATAGFPWEAVNDAPAGREGTVAYGPDPDEGQCAPNENDVSSRDGITSPSYAVPAGQAPRLQFEHYVATEAGYDGGNVKVSVNGGAFTLVPASAYLFNPYNATMTAAPGNTSPIAGQPGFTGTDGGEVVGTWGTSIIQLAKLGLKSGDSFKIKYDFGRDGCGGNDGWYVDDLVLTVCKKKTVLAAVHVPEPSTYGTESTVDITAPTSATGTVTLKLGESTIGTDTLQDGAASITLPATTPPGTYAMTVSYPGDDGNGAAETPVTVTVNKAASTTTVTSFTSPVKRTKTSKVVITVGAGFGTPGGTVKLLNGTKVLGAGTLSGGTVTITTRKLNTVGTLQVIAKYLGATRYLPSQSAVFRIRVVK